MKNYYVFPIILLFGLAVFISCAVKTPVPDSQQTQAYKMEDLPLSDNLVKHINSKKKEKYIIYTFYTQVDKERIHKQYWEGIIVFDDLPEDDQQASSTTDNLGNKAVDWRKDSLRESYNRDVYNIQGLLYKRTTINPDGSAVDSLDLNGDGIVDYMETLLPNGDIAIIVAGPAEGFLDDLLKGNNPYCNHSDIFGVQSDELPGCGNNRDSGESSSGVGLGDSDAGNPYHDYMAGLCSGYESSNRDSLNVGTRGRNLLYQERNNRIEEIEDQRTETTEVRGYYDDGTTIINRVIERSNDSGYSETVNEVTINNPDGTSTTTSRSSGRYPGGETFTQSSVTNCESGTCVTRETTKVTSTSGTTSSQTTETETTCSDDNLCTTSGPIVVDSEVVDSGSGTEHPGFEADHEAAMAEFCQAWNQSREDRPNDVSELNERANEERCSIAPDESASSDDSSLAETCYFDIAGRDEIAEIIAGGSCVTASGGAHFDYVSNNPQGCRKNKFFILERGLLVNGASGVSGVELCEDDLACDPADF